MKTVKMMMVGALLAGCTVMVNGKPRRIGGGSAPEPQAANQQLAPAPAQGTSAQGTSAQQPAQQPPARPGAPAPVVAIDPGLTRDPLLVPVSATFDTTWSKVFGHRSTSPNCGLDITSRPIASFDVKQLDTELTISVLGARNDGFVVRKGDLYWTTCTHSIGEAPTMAPVKDGWQPGRYDIFPVGRGGSGKAHNFQIELYKPKVALAWDKAQKLVISGKLAKPMFVEVSTSRARRVMREAHAGDNCDKLALPATPDIALTIERPIPGLVIRPMPSTMPVTLRGETAEAKTQEITGRSTHRKFCRTGDGNRNNYSSSNRVAPSYRASSELHFGKDEEGTHGISLGTVDANTETKVTLMVFDDSTKFDDLTVRPFGGETPTLEQRWVGFQLPQLDLDDVGKLSDYANAERTAKVFAAVPKQALVYAKLDWDKDLAGGDAASYPVKNEPLAVVGFERERVTVMAADGHRYTVKQSHVVLAPDGGAPALLAKPRPTRKLEIGSAISLLPPSAKKLGEAHYKRLENREKCRDNVWAPYGRQLPTYTRPAGVDIVVYKSARTRQIEDAGEAAMDRTCGTDEQSDKLTEQTRVKLLVEVEKGRAKLLAEATAHLR